MTKKNHIYEILAVEFDMATDLFCIISAIDEYDFEIAMLHHFDYLMHRDEWKKLVNACTEKKLIAFWDFEDAIKGDL